jgi:hypothetical protein
VQNRPETGMRPGDGNYERSRERARTLAALRQTPMTTTMIGFRTR